MRPAATELATRISRALITASLNNGYPTRSWTPSLEQTLHKLGCRDSLSPLLVARVIDPHLLTHHWLALGFFNWASQQPGFTHTSLTYQSVLKSLSLSRQLNAIESLLKQVRTQKITLDSSIFCSVINALLQGKKTQNAFWVFNNEEVKSRILDIGPETCNFLLAALASDGCLDNALKLFDEMTRRGVAFSTLGFGVFLWKFCRNGDLGRALSMLDQVKKGNPMINGSIIAVLVVHGLCQASRLSEALWVLNELRNRGCKPDFMAYRIVAEASRSTSSVVDVNNVLKMKRKLGVAPRSNDYREFILNLITERRVCEAKELGQVIVDGNFPIEDDVLNALIGSVSSIDPCSALGFFNFIVRKGSLPTLLTLSNLSRNLLRHGKIDELLKVYSVLSSNGYFSDMESNIVMFSFLCKAGKVREAYGILQDMKKKGLGPDITMYNTLMEACCKEDLLRPAKRLWDEMFVIGCGVNLKTYNILIGKLSERAEVEDALRLFNHMLENGVSPDTTTYTSILEGLCQETKFEAAVEVFSKLINQDAMQQS
uniref:Pentatricopeptide repeat-containing protein n=1 Tax=Rhizophora mucronata TaxID=61149 RepID=A0A2P2M0F1_RHIMU